MSETWPDRAGAAPARRPGWAPGSASPWPDLFVVGAQKAGTTAVHEILGRHPDVFASRVKEPRYFAPVDPARTRRSDVRKVDRYWATDAYLELFRAAGRRLRLESSTAYLYDERAPTAIARQCPDARIVVILREPVERAFSAWMWARRRGWENEVDFARALALEEQRIRDGWATLWHYRRRGMYAGQVARYLDAFGRDRVFVRSFDLLRAEPRRFFQELLEFLGLPWPPGFDVAGERNRGALPRIDWLNRLIQLRARIQPELRQRLRRIPLAFLLGRAARLLDRRNLVPPAALPRAAGRELQPGFVEDILATERLTGQPLRSWLDRYRDA